MHRVGELLPAQGPIEVFVHHNPLHAFEALPFEQAVLEAQRGFRCEPYLHEQCYRREFQAGRIEAGDLDAVLNGDLGERATELIAGLFTRAEFRRQLLRYGIPEASGKAVHWLISETGYGQRFRRDLPRRTRQLLAGRAPRTSAEESRAVRRLWNACVAAAQQLRRQPKVGRRWTRHRDALLEACGVDTDDWVHPLLIRFLSAFLDQGLAYWPIPYREHGLYRCFLALYTKEGIAGFATAAGPS